MERTLSSNDMRPQWRKDLEALLRKNMYPIMLSFILLIVGISMCLGLSPQERDFCDVVVSHTNAKKGTVANWTLSSKTTGLALANEHCAGGTSSHMTFVPQGAFVMHTTKDGTWRSNIIICGVHNV